MRASIIAVTAGIGIVLGAACARSAQARAAGDDTIVGAYLKIQAALAADTLPSADDRKELVAAAERLTDGGPEIRAAAAALVSAADAAAVRAAFGKLSDALIPYTRTHADLATDTRVAYCPMAGKYWLQKGSTPANPYYPKMQGCVEFVK